MTYEERERQLCRECSRKETCPYISRKMEYKCQHLSDMMYGWELGYKDAIEKVYERIKSNLDCYVEVEGEHAFETDLKIHTDLFIEDLKNYMEEQQ